MTVGINGFSRTYWLPELQKSVYFIPKAGILRAARTRQPSGHKEGVTSDSEGSSDRRDYRNGFLENLGNQ